MSLLILSFRFQFLFPVSVSMTIFPYLFQFLASFTSLLEEAVYLRFLYGELYTQTKSM